MKISITISVIILALAALIGWRNYNTLSTLRGESERLSAAAIALGIPLDNLPNTGRTYLRPKRQRADKLVVARRMALEAIGLDRELRRREESGEVRDYAMSKRSDEVKEQFRFLDENQLKALIDEFKNADDLNEFTRGFLLNYANAALSERNPKAALELLTGKERPYDDDYSNQCYMIRSLSNWAETDLSSALAWVRASNLDFLGKEKMETALISGVARNDVKLAFDMIDKSGISAPGDVVAGFAGDLKDPAQRTDLLRLIKARPDQFGEKEISAVMKSIGMDIGLQGYEKGVRWIKENKLGEAEILGMMNGGMLSLVKDAEIGNWVEWMGESLSPEPRDYFIDLPIRQWTVKDPRAAGEWLAALPDGPAKPASVAAFAETVAPYDPQVAAQWALTLSSGEKRNETLKKVYEKWPQDDPARASFMAEYPTE